jgi:hypothetical protein
MKAAKIEKSRELALAQISGAKDIASFLKKTIRAYLKPNLPFIA